MGEYCLTGIDVNVVGKLTKNFTFKIWTVYREINGVHFISGSDL